MATLTNTSRSVLICMHFYCLLIVLYVLFCLMNRISQIKIIWNKKQRIHFLKFNTQSIFGTKIDCKGLYRVTVLRICLTRNINKQLKQFCITGFYKIFTGFLKLNSEAKKTTDFITIISFKDLTLHAEDFVTNGSDGWLSRCWIGCFLSLPLGFGHQSDMREEELCWCGSAPQLADVHCQQKQPGF